MRATTRFLTLLFTLGIASATMSAPLDPIVTDRPDFTESAATVPFRYLQIENGYTYSQDGATDSHTMGEWLIRWGITPDVELRFSPPSIQIEGDINGFTDSGVGVKFSLLQDTASGIPATSIILLGSILTGVSAFREADIQLTSKLCMGWDISDQWSVASNINVGWNGSGDARCTQWAGSTSLGYSISDTMGTYFEYYGLYPTKKNGDSTHVFNTGLSYLINSNLQVDIRIGKELGNSSWFLGAGSAVRFPI